MMHLIGCTAIALSFFASSAHAQQPPAPVCFPLAKIKSDADPKTHFVALTAGQFHFMQGLYVGSPKTPPGLPPGQGAMLLTHDGDKGGVIVWTRGKDGCSAIPIPDELIKMLRAVKTGVDETLPPV